MARPVIVQTDKFEDYPVFQDPNGSRLEILQAIKNTFDYLWTACNRRLYVCHFTIHLEQCFDQEGNDFISGTLQSWRKTMLNHKIKAEYLWVREQGDQSSDYHPHYHVFVIIQGKFIQAAQGIAENLNRLLGKRLQTDRQVVRINPPQSDGFRWGKKVSAKLDNFADAISWVSYLAKASTKQAPPGQKTFSFSKGYLKAQPPEVLSPEQEQQEELWFEGEKFDMSHEDWQAWGDGTQNWEEILGFNPATGETYPPKFKRTASVA